MGFSIKLDEDTARRLHEAAERQNVDAQALGLSYVRDRVRPEGSLPASDRETRLAKFREMLKEVEEFGRHNPMPSLPDEALTREAIYADHD